MERAAVEPQLVGMGDRDLGLGRGVTGDAVGLYGLHHERLPVAAAREVDGRRKDEQLLDRLLGST